MIKLRVGKNLNTVSLELGEPWEFIKSGTPLQKLSKTKRREAMLKDDTEWNVYSVYEGNAPNLRIDDTNPAKWQLGFAGDYDRKYTSDDAVKGINALPAAKKDLVPIANYLENSLSGNIRLLWLFARRLPMMSREFQIAFNELLVERLKVREILLGYDEASTKPSQLWTNGATWSDLNQPPISYEWLLGLVLEVSKRAAFQGKQTIPLEKIHAEMELRYPGRWKGEFKLDATGVRIWDEKADNECGCQVKLDGMLCFTGPFPFRTWSDILGSDWVKKNTELNNGKIMDLFRYNVLDQNYHVRDGDKWEVKTKDDVLMKLRTLGVSSKIPKGETASEADHMVMTIQQANKVSGVGPIISKPPGIVEYLGYPFLNTYDCKVVMGVPGATKTEADFPHLWQVLQGFQTTPKSLALPSFLFWHRRRYLSQRDFRGDSGQAAFIGGEPNTGKTLVAVRVVTASLGGQHSNPFRYFTGQTNFNVQLFSKAVLMVNDEESPNDTSEKRKMHARLKGIVVNPTQEIEAKFRTPTVVEWKGCCIWTMNLDAGDVYQIPEVTSGNDDKLCFWRMVDTGIKWNDNSQVTEEILRKELPHYLWWLEHVFQPPKEILATGNSKFQRMGMISYFDPLMRRYSLQNTDAYSVWELLEQWIKIDDYWFDAKGSPTANEFWIGTSAELLTLLHSHDQLKPLLQGVTARSLPKSLSTLSKQSFSGVMLDPDSRRHFKISRHLSDQV